MDTEVRDTGAMRYDVYALTLESELEFPEFPLAAGDGTADVFIMAGTVPDHVSDPQSVGVLYEASADEFLLRVPDVASYYVTHDKIVAEPTGGSDHEVRVFLLGSAMGALLHMRNLLVMHAAAFATEHGAVLLSGHSGAGKSTLLGAMLDRGYQMVVDDVCPIDVQDGTPMVLAGYPRTRLWADSAEKLDVDTGSLTRTRPSLEKFERQLDDRFEPEPQPLAAIYLLHGHNKHEIEVEQLSAIDTFETVLANTYRRSFLEGLDMRDSHFKAASFVAATTRVVRIARPSGAFLLDELADAIEADLAAAVAGSATPQ